MKVYLAGSEILDDSNWRSEIVNGLNGPVPYDNSRLPWWHWGTLPQAVLGIFDYVGPYRIEDEAQATHPRICSDVQDAIENTDIVMLWTGDWANVSVSRVSVELTLAHTNRKTAFLAGPELPSDLWIGLAKSPAYPLFVHAQTPRDALIRSIQLLYDESPASEKVAIKKIAAPILKPDSYKNLGYIYLIQAETGHYKIGRSRNVPERMRLFSVKLPFKFEILHQFPCQDMYTAESDLHEIFADKRVNGEWFSLSSENVSTLTNIKEYTEGFFISKDNKDFCA